MSRMERDNRTSLGKDVETLDPVCMLVESQGNGVAAMENGVDDRQKVSLELSPELAIPLLGKNF